MGGSTADLSGAALMLGAAAGLGGLHVALSGKALGALAKVAEGAAMADAVNATMKTAASAYQDVQEMAGTVGNIVSTAASGASDLLSSVVHGVASAGGALAHYAVSGLSAAEHLVDQIV